MIALVVGMHRSGTSSVAGLLHTNGVTMGEPQVLKPWPNPENPRGFFENHRFRRLNDRIVESCGYRVASFSPDVPPCAPGAAARLRMRWLLRRYAARQVAWGFKDPRTCLTLDAWLRELEGLGLLERTRVVFTLREPASVASSLSRRNGLEPAAALRLWRVYNDRALAALDAWRPPTHYLRYEDLCARPRETAAALFDFIGWRASVATDFVTASLDRSSRPVRLVPPLDPGVRHTRALLHARARG